MIDSQFIQVYRSEKDNCYINFYVLTFSNNLQQNRLNTQIIKKNKFIKKKKQYVNEICR